MSRATKSGFAAEAQAKIFEKFSADQAQELLRWIQQVTGQEISDDGSIDAFCDTLKSGVVLCNLANSLEPGAIKKINTKSFAMMQRENIMFFTSWARDHAKVPQSETFEPDDLYEKQDPNSVVICLSSLARKADKYGKPTIGPRETKGERREWTDEQLRAGEGVIGLQMGSNKGANQAGMNFGKARKIVD